MIDGKPVLAIVPARGGSKGLPGKNLRPLAGRPLVQWPVLAAVASAVVDHVIVSTDDPDIADAAALAGAEAPFIRPRELATDTAPSALVIRHGIDYLAARGLHFAYVVMLEPTSPLTEPADIDAALRVLHSSRDRADAIVGIARVEATHPEYDVRLGESGLIRPYAAPSFASLRRRQEIEPLYFLEGSLYASAVPAFMERGGFYHERTLGHVMPRWKAFEVDELVDLVCIEAILARRGELHASAAD